MTQALAQREGPDEASQAPVVSSSVPPWNAGRPPGPGHPGRFFDDDIIDEYRCPATPHVLGHVEMVRRIAIPFILE